MRNGLRLLGAFVKQKIGAAITIVISFGIFAVVFSLYSLPLESVSYAMLLTAIFLLFIGIVQFILFYKKHRQLDSLLEQIHIPNYSLPQAKDLIELDYQQIIHRIDAHRTQMMYEKDRSYQELMEYYTTWAHQIKTPIAAMRLLLQAENSDSSRELLEQLFKIEQYVEMVLQYIRIDNMGTDFLFQRHSLDDLVKQAVRKYAPTFIRKRIKLEYEPLDIEVLTDEKWLVFVIEQLLSNALKYTKEGSVSIYMDPAESCTLVIEDTGIGIATEDLPRVFEQGFTGYNGRSDKKSTGIGLYLCKKTLDKLSHTLRIESTVGRGTQVKIGLDMVQLEVE